MSSSYASILSKLVSHGSNSTTTLANKPSSFGLNRTRKVLTRLLGEDVLDNQLRNRIIHIVGTNGKGSVSWKVASYLHERRDLTVGLYTSPHLLTVRERIRVNGEMISKDEFEEVGKDVLACAENDSSYFELMTCLAITHFVRKNCAVCVLEAGMGGFGDATNVLTHSKVVCLTTVALDHVKVLGNSLESICEEKIKVVKPGSRVVIGPSVALSLNGIIFEKCIEGKAQSVKRLLPSMSNEQPQLFDEENSIIARACVEEFISPLATEYNEKDFSTRPPCRMEHYIDPTTKKSIILDVGHNPAALSALVSHVKKDLKSNEGMGLIFAIANDKDLKGCLQVLINSKINWKRIEFVHLSDTSRKMADPDILKGHVDSDLPIGVDKSVSHALESLLQDIQISRVLVCGSHTLIAQALTLIREDLKQDKDPFDTNEKAAIVFG